MSPRPATASRCATTEACTPKPRLSSRPLLPQQAAGELAEVFKVLANETRLRLLHALARKGELCVNDLAGTLGMSSQAISNQLQRLSDRAIVATRREGTSIYYRITDPCVLALLDQGLCLAEDAKKVQT